MKRNLSSLEILVILHLTLFVKAKTYSFNKLSKLQFMRRILSLYIFSFIVAIGLNGCNCYDRHVAEILDEIARSGVDTSLSGIVSYEWDRMYVIGPYQSFECSIVKGIPNTLNKNFVSYSEVGSKTISDLGIKRASVYRPESVIPFKDEGPMIIDFANDKRPIFDGDRSFNKLNKWVEELESSTWLSSTA